MILISGSIRKKRAWQVKAIDTSYLAESDGDVIGLMQNCDADTKIEGYTDSSNPPTTERGAAKSSSTGVTGDESFTMPVIKGDYWKVADVGTSGTFVVFWIPEY